MLFDALTGKRVPQATLVALEARLKNDYPQLFNDSGSLLTVQYKKRWRKPTEVFQVGKTDKAIRKTIVTPPPAEVSGIGFILDDKNFRLQVRYCSTAPQVSGDTVEWPNRRTITVEDGMALDPRRDLELTIFLLYVSANIDHKFHSSATARFEVYYPELAAATTIEDERATHQLKSRILFGDGGFDADKVKEVGQLLGISVGTDEAVNRTALLSAVLGSKAVREKFDKFSTIQPVKATTTETDTTEALKLVSYANKNVGRVLMRDGNWVFKEEDDTFTVIVPIKGNELVEKRYALAEYILKDKVWYDKIAALRKVKEEPVPA